MLGTASIPPQPAIHDTSERLAHGFAERFVDACVRYDDVAANGVLDEALAVYSVEDVCLKVFLPALQRIGDLWQGGGLPVATEHLASGLIRDRLAVLMRLSGASPDAGLIVLTCAAGEHHEIGLLMLAVFLKRRGWRVLSLGANTPLEELDRVVAVLEPQAIIISVTQEGLAQRTYERCKVLTAQLKRHRTTLALGGRGVAALSHERTADQILVLPQDLPETVKVLESRLIRRSGKLN
jgi:methanogenic corrinoid protein MtbC1